jgi:molecular chaperone DnaK (HSP70)
MPGRLALDFGTSNTVAALWDRGREDGHTLSLPGLSRPGRHGERDYHFVPSLIHYDHTRVRVGQQVFTDNLRHQPSTFQWMKTYIGNEMRLPRQLGDRSIDFFQAGADFLQQVLIAAGGHANLAEEEIAFTLPVEAFERYQHWLDGVLEKAGVALPRYLDEPSAAALGYAARVRTGQPYLVFDFGGGTLDVAIVRVDERDQQQRRCRLLGKAGAQIGGSVIDQWLARDAATRNRRAEPAALRPLLPVLLPEAERVKESLSADEAQEFTALDPATGAVIAHRYTRGAFEDLLDQNGLYGKINAVLDAAESAAREHGYDRAALQAALMIGGGSLIPSVRRLVRARYGDIVRCDRPFEAVAVGAAAYVAGAGFDDRLRHAYVLRPYDRASGQYIYQPIVNAGAAYPGDIMRPDDPAKPLVLTVKASLDQQTRLGLQVYEVAANTATTCGGGGFDLVFDQSGGARYTTRDDAEQHTHRAIGSTTFIRCEPPAKQGEPRFLATFAIDAQRHLCVTVQDSLTRKTLYRNYPMVKLT